MLAVYTLWRREIVRFLRQRSRVIGSVAQPFVFWVLLGGGLAPSFQPPGAPPGVGYLGYLYPGILALVLLFTAIFATIATVEDRQAGFLQGVLAAPVSRATVVLGQVLGGTTLAVIQGILLLPLAPIAGLPFAPGGWLGAIGVMALVAFGLTSLGLVIAWRMSSTQGFHAIMNLLLLPMWLLSGAFFPRAGVAAPLAWIMAANPLTYVLSALRACLHATAPSLPALAASAAFGVAAYGLAVASAERTARG
jgi:ABC-2 type transport system permease protein